MIAAAVLFAHPAVFAQQDEPADVAETVEEIEEIGDVEVVTPEARVEKAGLFQAVGKFHPVVLHFPIAWLILLVIVEAVFLSGRAVELNRWGFALLVITLLSFVPAIVTGLGIASSHGNAAREFVEKMILHRNYNIAAGVVLLGALAVRAVIGQDAGPKARTGYLVLVLAAAGLMVFGSHLGGEMVWGEGFLPLPF